jgi:hypothetical protein
MITNQMYEASMALIFKDSKIVGWMSTTLEADKYCEKNHNYEWDFYATHKEYVCLKEIKFITLYS